MSKFGNFYKIGKLIWFKIFLFFCKDDSFANPQPPSNYKHSVSRDDTGHLTNDDFRKLLMTPSVGNASAAVLGGSSVRAQKINQSVRSQHVNNQQK